MNLDDNKTGYVVEIRNGDKYLMLCDVENVKFYEDVEYLLVRLDNKSCLVMDNRYNKSLCAKEECFWGKHFDYDVVKVWKPRVFHHLLQFDETYHKLIYERKEKMEKKNDVVVVMDETGRMTILAPRILVNGPFVATGEHTAISPSEEKELHSLDEWLKDGGEVNDWSILSFIQNQKKKEEALKQQARQAMDEGFLNEEDSATWGASMNARHKPVSEVFDSEICTAENAADFAHDVNFDSVNVNKFLSWLFNKIIELAKKGQYECEVLKVSNEFVSLERHERAFIRELLEQLNFNVIDDEKTCSWNIDWHSAAQIM